MKNFEEEIDKIKSKLKEIYGNDYYNEVISKLSNKEISELIQNLSNGVPIATPVFDGASTQAITEMLNLAKLPNTGQTHLWNGQTGERFDRPVTVGIIYMLKLNHLVEDKIHARSTGPYSLVTQQPLAVKHNQEAKGLAKWRFGLWKHMVLLILYRKYLLLNQMM